MRAGSRVLPPAVDAELGSVGVEWGPTPGRLRRSLPNSFLPRGRRTTRSQDACAIFEIRPSGEPER
jgi:hypothetical protein